jgi:chemotaxis protein MotB
MLGTEEQVEESENYFVSMTDMMVGMLFIFIIMLMVFALNYRRGDDDSKRIKDCLTELLTRNAELGADINNKVNKIQSDVRDQIKALELAADQRKQLLSDISKRLIDQGLAVQVDERNGVLRLTEDAVRFAPDHSDLDSRARDAVTRVGRALADVVAKYAACKHGQTEKCGSFQGASLETIFIEGHTDPTGVADIVERDRRNWLLSTERATVTYRAMLAGSPELLEFRNRRGEQIISVSGYSSTRPIATGEDRLAWERNRRIDLRFVMDADTTINLKDIIALNEEVKTQIARLAAISQDSIQACK